MREHDNNTTRRTPTESQPTRAVLYARLASVHGDLRRAEVQLAQCRHTAEQHGLTVVGEYVDLRRPPRLDRLISLRHLLDDIPRLNIAVVVTVDDPRPGSEPSPIFARIAAIYDEPLAAGPPLAQGDAS